MEITTNEKGETILKEVYSGVGLETIYGEFMRICMRDSGFEFNYQGKCYEAKKGKIRRMKTFKQVKMTNKNKGALTRIYGDAANDTTATFQLYDNNLKQEKNEL